jgi:hypothetical protein
MLGNQRVDALVLVADGEDHRNVQQLGKLLGIDLDAPRTGQSAMLRANSTLQSSSLTWVAR